MKLNLVMIVKDAERSLKKCLEHAASLVDDIIIADTGSTDKSKEIAKACGAKIFDFQWCDDFSAARNFALEHSDADWNLILDADEYVRSPNRKELEQAIERLSLNHKKKWLGALTCYNQYSSNEGNEVSTVLLPRLLPRGVHYVGRIHEQPSENFPCYRIPLEVDHDGYLIKSKGDRNLTYLQKAVEEAPDDTYYRFQLGATFKNLGRLAEAVEQFRYFYKGASVSDGYYTEGVLLYLYTLMDIGDIGCLAEAWEIINKEESHFSNRSDYWFVCGLFYMKLVLSDTAQYIGFLPRIESSYLKCLKIGEHPEQGGVVGTGSFKAAYNLGCWYEVSGQLDKAKHYYQQSAKQGYQPAIRQLKTLNP